MYTRYFGKVCQLRTKRVTAHSFATMPRRVRKIHIEGIGSKACKLRNLSLSSSIVHVQSVYDAEFEFLSVTLVVEEVLVVQMYINPKVSDILSLETCVCHDICMAKGRTEAVVESFCDSYEISDSYNKCEPGFENMDLVKS